MSEDAMSDAEFEQIWNVTDVDYGGASIPILLKESYEKQYKEAKRARAREKELEKRVSSQNKWIEAQENTWRDLKNRHDVLLCKFETTEFNYKKLKAENAELKRKLENPENK